MTRQRQMRMKISAVVVVALLLGATAAAQTAEQSEGIDSGNYNIRQSFEFGYRYVDTSGNADVYNTFVNMHTGPRLLDQSLDVRSLNHQGTLFDNLSMSSFGWFGDPSAATRLRISKNKWYNFAASIRYDRNSWDYNLLANPLNPATSNPFVPIPISPHEFQTTRRIGDYDLTLFPESRVRVRLGFSRVTSDGLSFSTIHEGTDTLLNQDWRNTGNTFRMGVDFRMLPHTNISYDQFLAFYKGDTSWADTLFPFQLANGTPLDLGIVWNTGANTPCATPILNPLTAPPTAAAGCNGYLGYNRVAPIRTFIPTEQLSLQGNYWKKLDVSARFNYSDSEVKGPLLTDLFRGFVSRTHTVQEALNGTATPERIQGAFDFGVTYHISDRLRVSDTFRWSNYHIPGIWDGVDAQLFAPNLLVPPNPFNPTTCAANPATCPQHIGASSPDITAEAFNRFLGQEVKQNTIEVEYDFTPRIGAHLGYRYADRYIRQRFVDATVLTFFPTLPNRGDCTGLPLNPDGSCTTTGLDTEDTTFPLSEHTALFGLWARPTDALRVNVDLELASQGEKEIDRDPLTGAILGVANAGPTRITPNHWQRYNFRANYSPVAWANFGAALNIYEFRNNVAEIHNLGHNRDFSLSADFSKDWIGLDLSYNYNNTKTNTDVCYVINPFPATAPLCPGSPITGGFGAFVSDLGFYDSTQNFGTVGLMLKPVKRVTTNLGYSITSVDGSQLLILGIQPVGPLRFNYHAPFANVQVDITKHVAWKAAWNYWGYNEKENLIPDPTLVFRDFHGNMATVSVRYSF